jgi:hypothetical protein
MNNKRWCNWRYVVCELLQKRRIYTGLDIRRDKDKQNGIGC